MTKKQSKRPEKDNKKNDNKIWHIVKRIILFAPVSGLVLYLSIIAGLSLVISALLGIAALLIEMAGVSLLIGQIEKTIPAPKKTQEEKNDEYTKTLIEANSELASFNYTISHEIKAPVRAIDGYARIFIEDYGERIDAEGQAMIDSIRSICRETIALSNKLMEYTQFAQEQPCNEVVDIKKIVEEVFVSLKAAEKADIELCFETPLPYVIGDKVLLQQALSNILSNAYKFTRGKTGGLIAVGFGRTEDEDVFFVRDNGAGFDMQFSQKLFCLFQRMHKADEFEGSGLGLSIVKKIILLHKGRVWITGEVGNGATVYFTFPPDKIFKQYEET